MRRLIAFENISLDGYFTDRNNDMSWAQAGSDDPEFSAFVSGNASGRSVLVMGRVTYQMMAAFWPTTMAMERMPAVAKGMNDMQKLVFSRTLNEVGWNNTALVKGDLIGEIAALKKQDGPGMVIMGSGSLVAQLAPERLIDEYQVVLNPVIIGAGRTLFEGMKERQELKLARSRIFGNGKVFLGYAPA
jgi:dihydrofolate reductase